MVMIIQMRTHRIYWFCEYFNDEVGAPQSETPNKIQE